MMTGADGAPALDALAVQCLADAAERALDAAGADPRRPLLAAFSGGADSTALLLALAALAERGRAAPVAAHFNHHEGAGGAGAAAADAAAGMAARLGVRLMSGSGDVAQQARRRGMSLEAAGREMRYAFLARAAAECGAQAVATGHTWNDHVETVLMNIMRGAGERGVAGMQADRVLEMPGAGRVRVLRPLLKVEHAACVRACEDAGAAVTEDRSNADERFTRNRVRRRLLPLLEAHGPAAADLDAVSRRAAAMHAALEARLDAAGVEAQHCRHGVARIPRAGFNALPAELRALLLLRVWRGFGAHGAMLGRAHVERMAALAEGSSGGAMPLPGGGGLRVCFSRLEMHGPGGRFACGSPEAPLQPAPLPPSGALELGGGFRLSTEVVSEWSPPDSGWTAYLGLDALGGGAVVRRRRSGDRFHPLGLPSSVKLKDFLNGAHVPAWERAALPLVEGRGGIAWVGGCRVAEWARVRPGARRIMRIEVTPRRGGRCW